MKIKIGFSQPKNNIFPIFSWAIRAVEKTEYSHVLLQWESGFAQSTITYHAAGTSLHFLGVKKFNKTVNVLHSFEMDITREQYGQLLKYCFENAGTSYGYKQIIGIAYAKVASWVTRKKVKNPFQDGEKSQVCSELVGHVLTDVLSQDLELDLDTAGPRAIYEFMCKLADKGGATRVK